jgi:hypothetical protein
VSRCNDLPRIAHQYWESGWSPFPLPRGAKFPPPPGITGERGRDVTRDDITGWSMFNKWANVGLRMPDGIVGIDLDLYKPGDAVADGLPPTVRSTSRVDGSGIYMFRAPEGTKLQGSIPGLGEVIQAHHRYAVVWPSLHPEGREYLWLADDDREVDIPYVDELPWLPESWLQRLQDRSRGLGKRGGKGYDGDASNWLADLPGGRPSAKVRTILRESMRDLRRYRVTGDCRYDAMNRNVGRLVSLGAQRQRGVEQAIDELFTEYTVALDGEPDRDPQSEFFRSLEGAIAKWGAR